MRVIILAIMSFFPYLNTLNNGFVWDDVSIVVNNRWIRNPLKNFFNFFINKDTVSEDTRVKPKIYRPLTTITYAVDYCFWKLDPVGYHLSNIFYHFLTVVVVYLVSFLLVKDKEVSFIISLLFALHPIHTEAVSWVKGRADVLATMFGLISFYFYILSTQDAKNFNKHLTFSFLFFVLALFSKESALSFFLIIIIYDFIFLKKFFIKNYFYFGSISVLYIILRKLVIGSVAPCGWWGGSWYYTYLTMTKVFTEYFRLLILPINLCADYVVNLSYGLDTKVIASLFVIILLIVFVFLYAKRYPIVSFSILFVFAGLIPVSNIIPIEVLLAERFLYLSSFGFCLLLGWSLYFYFSKRKILLYIILFLILTPYVVLTYQRNKDWKDEFSLWQKTVKQMPDNFRAHNNLAMEYEKMGDFTNALYHYHKALTLMPNLSLVYNDKEQVYASVYNNIGNVYLKQGDFNLALQNYQKAIELNPNYSQPYFNIGLVFRKLNNFELAVKYYNRAIELNPYVADYYNNLGVVYALKDDFLEAINCYKKAFELSTDEDFKKSVEKNIEIAKNFLNKK